MNIPDDLREQLDERMQQLFEYAAEDGYTVPNQGKDTVEEMFRMMEFDQNGVADALTTEIERATKLSNDHSANKNAAATSIAHYVDGLRFAKRLLKIK